ncbi:hypothetical protein GCM10028784_13900 [Myceligenerans cantabricum]
MGFGMAMKIASVLAVPVLMIGATGAYLVSDAAADAAAAEQTSELVSALEHGDEVLAALASEQALAVSASRACDAGEPCIATVTTTSSAQQRTRTALAVRDQAFESLETGLLDERVPEAIDQTLYDRKEIWTVQEKAAAGTLAEQQVTKAFAVFLDDATEVAEEVVRTGHDRELTDLVEAYQRTNELLLTNTYERALFGNVLAAVAATSAGPHDTVVLRVIEQINLADFQYVAAQEALDRIPADYSLRPMDGSFGTVRTLVASGTTEGWSPALGRSFTNESAAWHADTTFVRDAVRADAVDLAAGRAEAAHDRVVATAVATGGALLLVVAIGVTVPALAGRRAAATTREVVVLEPTEV